MNKKNGMLSDRAVSETVGFIIIFGIALTGIGLVTLYGYPALLQEQANANIKNMQKNMIVLQNDIKSLTFKNTPYQETNMIVSGGTLLIKNETTMPTPVFTLRADGTPILPPFQTGKFLFNSMDGMVTLALENGAVHAIYWNSPSGSAMISEPRWFYDPVNSIYVLQFIRVIPSDNYLAQTGIGTVRMQLVNSSQQSWDITGKDVRISYTPDLTQNYKIAWRNYLSKPELQMTSMDPTNVEYKLNTGAKFLVVKQYNITVLSI